MTIQVPAEAVTIEMTLYTTNRIWLKTLVWWEKLNILLRNCPEYLEGFFWQPFPIFGIISHRVLARQHS